MSSEGVRFNRRSPHGASSDCDGPEFARLLGGSSPEAPTQPRASRLGAIAACGLLAVITLAGAGWRGARSRGAHAHRVAVNTGAAGPPHFESKAAERALEEVTCPNSAALSDFASRRHMEDAGWEFGWADDFAFKPQRELYAAKVPEESYWGFKEGGGGRLSLSLHGRGMLALDFGNSFEGKKGSQVAVYLNGLQMAIAGGNTWAKFVQIPFKEGDNISVQEAPTGVMVINSISFNCVEHRGSQHTAFEGPEAVSTSAMPSGRKAETPAASDGDLIAAEGLAEAAAQLTLPEETSENARRSEELRDTAKRELEHRLTVSEEATERVNASSHAVQEEPRVERQARDVGAPSEEDQEELNEERKLLMHAISILMRTPSDAETPEADADPNASNQSAGANTTRGNSSQRSKELEMAQSLSAALAKLHRKDNTSHNVSHHNISEENKSDGDDDDDLEAESSDVRTMRRYSQEAWRQEEKAYKLSLFCFSLMMPFGYEPALLEAQQSKGVSIFACDEYSVFSNMTDTLSSDSQLKAQVEILPASLAVSYGGRWNTALNTDIFNRVWLQIVKLGRYRFHDWSVKADPDCVFFPSRLKELLALTAPMSRVPRAMAEPEQISCSACRKLGQEAKTCAAHVKAYQKAGRSCTEALELVAREPPEDCGCSCDDMACEEPEEASMYLNNCKWGLHGPLEVLSRRAVAAYVSGLPQCTQMRQHPWGEDKFMDNCMSQLGVVRTNQYRLLSETACGEEPAPCGTADVAFHPFKSIQSYFSCWGFADKYGHGPADPRGSWDSGDGRMGTYYMSRKEDDLAE